MAGRAGNDVEESQAYSCADFEGGGAKCACGYAGVSQVFLQTHLGEMDNYII